MSATATHLRIPIEASEQYPIYAKVPHGDLAATTTYFITCNEGWRESTVCEHMYEWAADWLLEQLGRKPFAPGKH